MHKKGFTLIELLAVIVILAIIALIATPMITGIINTAKKGGAESSALGWIDAVEKQAMLNMLDDNKLSDGTYTVDDLVELGVKVKGQKPSSGQVIIENGKINSSILCIDNYRIVIENDRIKSSTKTDNCSVELTAGIYDKDDNLVISWSDLENKYHFYIEEDYNDVIVPNDRTQHMSLHAALLVWNSETGKDLTSLTKLVIPEGVEKIGKSAIDSAGGSSYDGCGGSNDGGFEEIILPSTLKTLSVYSISHQNRLKEIVIPASVTKIGNTTFSWGYDDMNIIFENPTGWIDWNENEIDFTVMPKVWPGNPIVAQWVDSTRANYYTRN